MSFSQVPATALARPTNSSGIKSLGEGAPYGANEAGHVTAMPLSYDAGHPRYNMTTSLGL